MTEPNRSPRDCAHGGRSRAEWLRLPLIAVCVVLYLTGRPGGVLAQTQVAQPTIGAVTPGDGRLSIAWTAPQGVTGTTAYDLRHIRSDAADKADSNWTVLEDVWTAGSGDLTYTLEDLDNGVGYDVQMRAVTTTDGAWSATATGTPADHGGTLQTATTLPPATRTGGVIESGTDADFFKLELTAATGIIVHTRGDLDTVGQLLDGDGELLSENDVGDELHGRHNFLLWGSLQAGTYYVKVTASGGATGAYVLEATTVADSTARSDAHDVEVGSYGWGIIDPASSDRDWFRITLTAPTTLLIHSTGSAGTWGDLWQSGNLKVPNTEEFPLGTSPRFGFFVRVALGAGTYYVEVGGSIDATGAYALHVNRGAEPGSSTASAEPLVPMFPKAGTISPTDDVDYFRIELAEATHLILSATGSAVPIAGELLDSDGDPVDANIREARWTLSAPAGFQLRDRLGAGTHYLKVTRLAGGAGPSTGRYGLRMYEDYAYGQFIDGCTALTASQSDPLSDPLSGCQWHLDNTGQLGGTAGEDINVREVWEAGHLGAGATVALVDDGMDVEHPDLAPNILAERNYAYGGSSVFNAGNTHGTGAAGLIAARDNGIGVRGVAPRAQIYVYNIIDAYNHAYAAAAMTRGMETTAISNNSWSQTEGPGYATAPSGWVDAVVRGVTEGYGGKGVLYVRSGGNDAVLGANSNLSGFRNHYTGTAVCAVTDRGVRSHYSEQGANLWVCAPSGASYLPAAITTTDNFGRYRNTYGGTSATAAIVSGVAALLRGAHADLTWRDVKLILAGSARKNDPSNTGWEEGAPQYGSATERYEFNHEYGFGVVDAGAAMDLAAGWTSLPQLTEETQASGDVGLAVPDLPSSGTPTTVTSSITMGSGVQFTEFVSIHINLTAAAFRDLQIELESPSGKVSVVSPYHFVGPGECKSLFGILPGQCNLDGFVRLGSAGHLGEDPAGVWTLRIADHVDGRTDARLNSWRLTMYGHRSTPAAAAIDSVADGSEALTVAWTAPTNTGASGVTAYDVRSIRSDAADKSDSEWTVVDDAWTSTSGALEYTISGLTGNVQYDVQVRAVNADGDGVWSGTQTGTPTTDEAPTIDSATPGDRAITVEWTAPTNATLGTVTSYDLRHIRSDASDKADARWTAVTSIWTSGTLEYALNPTPALVNGVSYDVQVRAVVGTDQHPWSGVRSATPRTTPGAPTIDTVTGADGSLTVEWSAPASDGGDAIAFYDLRYIKTSADETDDVNWTVEAGVWGSGDLTATVAGLDSGTRYDVQVRAVNGAGAGAWSAAGVGTTRPGAPAIDGVTADVGGLTVAWSASATDGDAEVTSYDLRYIRTSADETVDANWAVEAGVWGSGDLTATVTGLELGTRYDVQVRAVNVAGEGPWSITLAAATAFSDDATLTGLTLSGVRLTPGFTGGVISYAGAVGYTVTRTTVAAARSDANAAVVILDGNGDTVAGADTADVDLSVGENVFGVRVTAQDGVATKTYTVTVTRTARDLSLTPPVSAPVPAFASTATYTIEFQGGWTAAATPDGVPGGAHFSRLIAAVHDAGVTFLRSGGAATAGIESMAEIGGTSVLRSEVRNAGPNAAGVVRGGTNSIGPTATQSLTVTLTTEHPLVTLVTMVAPSPDWFVGVSGLSLLDPGGSWLSSQGVRLYPWDAGTENGDEFSLSNPATSPRGVITSIRGTGKFSTQSIATVAFTLESVNFAPAGEPFITGAPEVGEELTVHTSSISDADGLASPGYSYQWLRVGSGGRAADISGATSDTYTVQGADVGERLAARVAFTDDESNVETLTGDATEVVVVAQVAVSFEATAYQAEEGGQRAAVRVVLDKDPHRTLRIPLRAAPGGGAGPSDYTAASQVTFGPGETAKGAPLSARDDSVDDDGESVTLSFGELPAGVSAGSQPETLVEIVDNDYVPVTLGWEETAFTAEEPTSPAALTAVTLRAVAVTATDKRPESDFSFDFTVNTANGTARQPGDYERLSSTGTFDRGDFSRTAVGGQFRWVASVDFTVNVVHDTVDEPSESFTVRLAFAGSRQPHLTLGDSTATVTTTDDVASLADLRATVSADSGAVEPGGQLTYNWSVYNSGPAASTNTVLAGTLDAAVTFVSAQVTSPATGQCSRSGRTVTCTFGTLELGGAASGEIVVEVKDDASADVRLTAAAAADQLDRTPADNSESAATALDAPPRQITDLRATAAGEHIDLAWSAPGDNGSAISRYELERKTGTGGFVAVAPSPAAGATSHRDDDVEEGAGYTYRLRAVNDDGAAEWSNEATATVAVNEPPEFSSSSTSKTSFSYPENRTSALYAYQATDPEGAQISWSLTGEDSDDFTISETGVLSFVEAPDYEFPADADQDNEYLVTVEARDDRSNVARLEVAVNVTNAAGAEEPTITTTSRPSVTFRENGTATVYAYRASDPQRGAISWSVTGPDADDFTIGGGGELTFASPPDFENPTDVNGDNVYELKVGATDEQGLTDSFEVTVTVTNHAEGVEPTISTRRPPSTYREHGASAVYALRASDPQRGPIAWTLDGEDSADFDLSAGGTLTFRNPPDFEAPADSNRDNNYELTVVVTDEDGHADRLSFTVAVTDVNEGPEISRAGSAPSSVAENYDPSLVLARYSATDPEGSTVSLWRTSGGDGGDFVIDGQGALRFRDTPDYERPADSNRDNIYVFVVQASDGAVYGSFEETVTVTPVNEAPAITTAGGSATELSQDENRASRLYTYRATDPERETITWSVGGADGHFFAIDERGRFSFKKANPPDFEQPADSDGDNVYDVAVQATDDTLNTASLPVTVTVTEVNEGPEVTGRTGFTISENQDLAGAAYTAVDPENPSAAITRWSVTGRDAADFAIDDSGRLTFRNTPDHERPADSGRDNVYNLSVRASDGRYYGYLEVTVTVTDVNEAPAVTGTDTFTFRENGTTALHTFRATDPERSDVTWSVSGQDAERFAIHRGMLTLKRIPDFENPADDNGDNVYDVTVQARDDALNTGTLEVTVTVADQDEAPQISGPQSLTFTENQATDRVLATYSAADPEDPGAAITRWSVTGRDTGDFTIDDNGELTFRNTPDYERPADSGRDNTYEATVRASDGRYYGYLEVTVTVTDVNEAPAVTGTETFNYRENGTANLYTFRATDPERSAIEWSLSGADDDDFTITDTGALAFAGPPDYESPTDDDGDNVYDITVQARDDALNTGTLDVAVTVTHQDEGPEISGPQSLTFSENQAPDRVLATYTAIDPENPTAAITRWSLTGHDAGDFTIDDNGRLTFRKVPDHERPDDSGRDNTYEATVRASDGRYYGYLEVTVTVEDVNEAPAVTGTDTFNYRENGTAAIYTFKAADPERGNITWSLSGADDDDFTITDTGALAFAGPPDYESPTDSGSDNVYEVTVQARDDALNTGTLEVAVTVTDVNEGPEITGQQSLTFTENQATDRVLATYSAADPEDPSAPITRWSVTGRDAGDFTIDDNGRLTFRRVPDHERPDDSGRDNVYNLSVRASDGRYYGYLEVTVAVTDVNEAPEVTGTDTFNYRENGTANLYTFKATDPERSAIEWSLSGADDADFTITDTGALAFANPPDYENAADSGSDNVYEVTVQAGDDALNSGTLDVVVTVTDVNEGPEISGPQSLTFTENQATDRVLATYSAADPENPAAAITRWSVTGRDAGDFTIDDNGRLTFRSIPDHEKPADSGRDNVYNLSVRASDGRYYGYLEVTVTVTDVNEAPAISASAKTAFTYRENGTANLYTFKATDPERGAIEWSLSGADAADFAITDTGVLAFAGPPDYENAADDDGDNVYEVTVEARDDAVNTGTLDVVVTVTDVNEGPEISGLQSLTFTENQATDRVLATYSAADPEDPGAAITRWSVTGRDSGDFTIDESGELTFRHVPDHEGPADSGRDNVYNLSVRASDGRYYGYLEVTVTVTDVNEAPAVTGTDTFNYRENGTAAIYTFKAADPERSAIEWSLSGADDADFTITDTGVLAFTGPPDYENVADSGSDNVYDITVEARDDAFNTGTLDVTVTVTDVNEGPEISGPQSLTFSENQATDRVLATYTAADPEDTGAAITRWSVTGRDSGDFTIDESGELTFRNVPDYEGPDDSGRDNVYNLSVRASDGRYYGYLEVTVTVTDVNEAPAITTTAKTAFTYRENGTAAIYTFKATDPERSTIEWSLSGADAADFAIENGALKFTDPPSFESPQGSGLDGNEYLVTVQARDDDFNTSSLPVTVTVTDVNEGPEISGPQSLTFTENQATDRVLATYSAADPEDTGAAITRWSVTGRDAGDFTIDESGELTFRKVPDHEKPDDSGRDNVYNLSVRASDGRYYGYLEVTVAVTDVNEAPAISASAKTAFTYRENGTAAIYTFKATDPERSAIEWSLSGPDADDFTITDTGVLAFAGPPDYENAADSGSDNVYDITVEARDDAFITGTLVVVVTVTDVNEGPEISGRQSLTFTENQATDRVLATYSAADPEDTGAAITRWSLTGRDAGDFRIDESGQLTFRSVPDYERPADSGRDNVYNLSVRASDGRYYGYLEVTVTVTDVNEAPAITTTAKTAFNYRENGTAAIYTFKATDPERSAIEWSLSGPDADDFTITDTGVVAFAGPPDYENAADDDGDNVYDITVEARDDAFITGTLDVVVTVTDVNEGPEISGPQSLTLTENQATDRALATYSAADPEDPSALITRWSVTGRDAGDFTIDDSGRLTFRKVPDHERPDDSGRDNIYEVTVRASDGRYYGYLEVTVAVTDVNEAPAISASAKTAFNYRENGTAAIYTFKATDPERGAIEWSLSGADAADFTIENGALKFTDPPSFESPQGSGLDGNEYLVTVEVRDDDFNTSSLPVTVTVTDQNEGPEISGLQSLTFTENQATDRVLATYSAADPENPSAPITRWSVTGRDAGDFTIDENGELTFRSIPDHERPDDSGRDNTYNLSVRASDGRYYGYLEVTVTVTDVNEAPAVTGTDTFNYRENSTANLYTFKATDPERSAIEWSLSGADAADFTITDTGVLAFAGPPDYESPTDDDGDNVYDITVQARDDAFYTGTLDVVVTVTDVNEGPEISGPQSLAFTENQATDRVLATYSAADPEDTGAAITRWSLTGTDSGDFAIDENGRLTFRSVPDYEKPADSGRDNTYNLSVRASDGRYYGYLEVTVTVTDVNEAPTITATTKTAFNYRENATANLYTFKATDPERSAIEWSLSGADAADFTITDTGVVAFAGPPDYENAADDDGDNVYEVTVQARDDDFNTGTLDVAVTVTDVNEGPEISGLQSLTLTENQATDRVLATYTAADPEDPSAAITRWSVTGRDAADFTIDENGRLTFRRVPDYERPDDSGRDNTYNLSVRASDGRYYGYLEVTVAVTDVNEAPAITTTAKTAFNYRENGTANLYTFKATDPERSAIEWSLSGADADDFTITDTGVLAFAGPPDYESPTDSGSDNVYDITVEARDDALNPGTLDVTVTVTDHNEGPEVTGRTGFTISENQDLVGATYSAIDPEDPGAAITRWSVTGRDAGDFTIDENGRLTFRSVPDYERPDDSGRDNIYEVTVRASDGRNYGYLEVTVTVEAVNEPPAIAGTTSFTYKENGTATLHTFRATDPERSAIEWSLSGADADDFTITDTGVLAFASAPDYESPTDTDSDNVYEVTVEARDDSFNTGTLEITITVVNLTD